MINVAKGKHEIKSTTIYLEQVATELASSINIRSRLINLIHSLKIICNISKN